MTATRTVFPHPAKGAPKKVRKPGMKAPTRDSITDSTDLGIDPKSQQEAGIISKNGTAPWPGNLNMVPNTTIRSSLFGCARIKADDRSRVYERLLDTPDQYVVRYRGHDLDQNDCEVWELALAWCRQSGKPIGARVHFTFAEWCRVLVRPVNETRINASIIESLKRLMTGFFIVKFPNGLERWIQPINDVGRDVNTGRAYLSFDPEVFEWLTHDTTEIDLRRKVSLRSDLARWMHDYYSSSSTPFATNLSTLMKRSGTPLDTPPSNFRIRVIKAVEELQQCTPPLFAPRTRVEKKQNGEYVLVVTKATNSRILPVKRAAPVVASLPAPSTPPPPPDRPAVAKPSAPTKQPVRLRKAPASIVNDAVPVWDRNVDPSDTRSSADRKHAYLRDRDNAEAAIYAVAGR